MGSRFFESRAGERIHWRWTGFAQPSASSLIARRMGLPRLKTAGPQERNFIFNGGAPEPARKPLFGRGGGLQADVPLISQHHLLRRLTYPAIDSGESPCRISEAAGTPGNRDALYITQPIQTGNRCWECCGIRIREVYSVAVHGHPLMVVVEDKYAAWSGRDAQDTDSKPTCKVACS